MAKIKLNGDTSGYIEISAPAVSGNNTLELGPGTKILTNLDNTFTGVSTFTSGLHVTGGNVSVGSNDPNGLLALTASSGRILTLRNSTTGSASGDGSYLALNGSDLQISNAESANISLYTADTERLRIDSTGQVTLYDSPGIQLSAKTSSLYNLDGALSYYATNNGVYLNGAGTNGWLRLNAGGVENNHNAINIFGGSAGAYISMHTSNNERVRINSSGHANFKQKVSIGESYTGGEIFKLGKSSGTSYTGYYNGGTAHGFIGYADQLVSGGASDDFAIRATNDLVFATNGTNERLRITSSGKLGIDSASPISKLQVGSHTFNGGNGMHNDDRVGMSNHGQLTGLMLASTYNDGTHPEYGLVFVQGPNTTSYNVWGVCPDGPNKGNSLNFHYSPQATNIHAPGYRKFQMTGDGYFLQPYKPKFRAGRSSSYSPGAGSDIVFNTVSGGGKHNAGNHYNTSNGRFTAPVAGVYTFTAHVIWEGLSSGQNMADCFHPKINGVVVGYSGRRGEYIANETGNSGYYTDFMTYQFNLAAGDYVTINNQFNLTIHGNSNYTTFSGHLVG